MQSPPSDADTGVMSQFLLGTLDAAERARVTNRLTDDPSYFEEMAAVEDDLILRWQHNRLPVEDRARFAEAYLASTARCARVEASLALVEAARVWRRREGGPLWRRLLRR